MLPKNENFVELLISFREANGCISITMKTGTLERRPISEIDSNDRHGCLLKVYGYTSFYEWRDT